MQNLLILNLSQMSWIQSNSKRSYLYLDCYTLPKSYSQDFQWGTAAKTDYIVFFYPCLI